MLEMLTILYVFFMIYSSRGFFMDNIIKKEFFCFNVYSLEDNYSFCHIEISNEENFYKSLFEYFFSEDKILRYAENNFHLKFTPSKTSYTKLYKNLRYFIDQKHLLENVNFSEFDEKIEKILNDEFEIENKDGKNFIKIDKFGKVGEYIFSHILHEYFELDCIIPKIKLTTNYNMSVFGIDSLFFSTKNNMILFGESKMAKTLENGIELIKKSLKVYEEQIKNEFLLTLSNRIINCNSVFLEMFQEHIDECIDFEEFVNCTGLKVIGIPIFIAHGCNTNLTDDDIVKIFNELNKLPKKKLCNLDTKYYSISLPIINKNKLMAIFTQKMQEKEEFYKNAR